MCNFLQTSFVVADIAAVVILVISIFAVIRGGYLLILDGDRETWLYVRKTFLWALAGFAAAFILGSADEIIAFFSAGASLLSSCGLAA